MASAATHCHGRLASRENGRSWPGKQARRTPRAVAQGEERTEDDCSDAFPFTAVMNQDELKLALLLNVVDPRIGGCLALGDRGCGKSAAVNALIDLLPRIEVTLNDDFNSSPSDPSAMGPDALERFRADSNQPLPSTTRRAPFVEVPLGATEDRVCGSIDIEKALSEGRKAFVPGLLARANRGVLFVDEVNLLDDSLVDLLLDAAAGGRNTVEREGISISHPAKFILVGAGSPTEGDLRPQLLDRFGMSARVYTVTDPSRRVQLTRELSEFRQDPVSFMEKYKPQQDELKQRLERASGMVESVTMKRELRLGISRLCSVLNLDGIRGDLVTVRAATALAALEQRMEVNEDDVRRVAPPCLRHRMRKDALSTIDNGFYVEQVFSKVFLDETLPDPEPQQQEKKDEQNEKKPGAWTGVPLPGRKR